MLPSYEPDEFSVGKGRGDLFRVKEVDRAFEGPSTRVGSLGETQLVGEELKHFPEEMRVIGIDEIDRKRTRNKE
jgi:hypothetical protein